jgi:hypothetical protein
MLPRDIGLWKLNHLFQSSARLPWKVSLALLLMIGQSRAEDTTNAASNFRLADGNKLAIEKWTDPYETLEYQPPVFQAKEVVRLDPEHEREIWSMALDEVNHVLYWIDALGYEVGHDGRIWSINLKDGSRKVLVNGLEQPRCLCLAPAQGKIFWLGGDKLNRNVASIFQANMDGSKPRAIVNSIQDCNTLQLAAGGDRLYWNNYDVLNVCKLDGTDLHSLPARCGSNGFAIDFQRNLLYYQDIQNRRLIRCNLDNTDRARLLRFIPRAARFIFDAKENQLYWADNDGIARAQLPDPIGPEQITSTNRATGYRPWFAIDSVERKAYWTSYWSRVIPGDTDHEEESFPMIVSGELPSAWKKVKLPAPPLVSSLTPGSAKAGDEIKVEGGGFQSTHEVWWFEPLGGTAREAEFKTASRTKADFRVVSDSQLAVKAPDLSPPANGAALIVRADGGVTVTLPRNLKLVATLIKPQPTAYSVYFVRKGGHLYDLGSKLIFLDAEGTYEDALGGSETVFVKNGGYIGGIGFRTVIFHEPFARLTFRYEDKDYISVGAIRPSFADKLFVPLSKN